MLRNKLLSLFTFTVICCLNCVLTDTNKPKTPWNATITDRLKHELLMHYDKFARPAQHYNTTTVTIGLNVLHIEVNEIKNTFTVHCWVKLMWKDEKLKWNTSEYDGFSLLHVADHEIWQPDIVPYNSAAGSTLDHYANTHCLVSDDGTVVWVPPAQYIVFCELDLRMWPFDTQKCWVKLGSWTYHGDFVDLKVEDTIQVGDTIPFADLQVRNSEWELLSLTSEVHTTMYSCCPEPYPDVSFNFTIQRRSPTYKAVIITPAFAVIAMTLLGFWLPSQAGEKILLNCCTAVIICLFLLYFSQKCPAMGDHTPLIVMFYSSSLYVISFCILGSVIVIWISRTQHQRPLPWVIKHALTGWLGKWLGLSSYINQTSISGSRVPISRSSVISGEELREQLQPVGLGLDHSENDASDERRILDSSSRRYDAEIKHHDWFLLAAAIDRLSFIFYALIFAILALTYSL